jgi:uncharacterized protein (DUF305 family)
VPRPQRAAPPAEGGRNHTPLRAFAKEEALAGTLAAAPTARLTCNRRRRHDPQRTFAMEHLERPTNTSAHLHHYAMFALSMALSLAVMYFVMFTMIDARADFRNNVNTFYMALTMVAPMGIIMLATMRGMYSSKRLNAALYVGLTIVFIAALAGTRTQSLVGDRQFVASMIPHHSGAILMCREANIADPELVRICMQIERTQRQEIEQMEAISARLKRTSKG